MHAELRWFVFDTLQHHLPQPGDRRRYELANNSRSHANRTRVTRLPILSDRGAD